MLVKCQFAEGYPEASCVLVYREYNNHSLTVIEYSQSTEFPITISIDKSGQYTFAVFGKNGIEEIDQEPVICMIIMAAVTPSVILIQSPSLVG